MCKSCKSGMAKEIYERGKKEDPLFFEKQNAVLKRNVLSRKIKQYGLTREEYDEMAARGCAICGGPPNGRGRYAFDHDHKTGKFRGLLCVGCNVSLGCFRDDVALLEAALFYLKKAQHAPAH